MYYWLKRLSVGLFVMLADCRKVDEGSVIERDICIIGAGPAGLTLAHGLEGTGQSVTILESGGEGMDADTQDLLDGTVEQPEYPLASDDYPLYTVRAKGVGGTSLRWGLPGGWRARALDPIDFECRAGVPFSGWPIKYEQLRPYYSEARAFLGLDADHDRVEYWSSDDTGQNLLLNQGQLRSVYFLRSDKSFFRNSRGKFAQSPKQRLLTFANVVALETDECGKTVKEAVVKTLEGKTVHVRAKRFVLAAGGIDNARLLLASNSTATKGLGNETGFVGRFFMEHPHIYTGYLEMSDRADALRMGFYSDLQERDGSRVEGMLSLSEQALRDNELPNAGFFIRPTSIRHILRLLGASAFGGSHDDEDLRSRELRWANFKENLSLGFDTAVQRIFYHYSRNRLFRLYVESEQVPNPASRVTLSDEKDRLGMPQIKLEWRLAEQDFDTIRRTQEVLDQELRNQGVGRLRRLFLDETPATHLGIGNHQIGTTRMSASPKEGVVDPNGRVHGVGNLYVLGSSVFPTGGAANPTLTIIAMALRMSDWFKQEQLETA